MVESLPPRYRTAEEMLLVDMQGCERPRCYLLEALLQEAHSGYSPTQKTPTVSLCWRSAAVAVSAAAGAPQAFSKHGRLSWMPTNLQRHPSSCCISCCVQEEAATSARERLAAILLTRYAYMDACSSVMLLGSAFCKLTTALCMSCCLTPAKLPPRPPFCRCLPLPQVHHHSGG